MGGRNDILASAGIDVDAFKVQIDTLIGLAAKGAGAVEETNKKASTLSKTLGGLGAGSAALNFGTSLVANLTGANVALGQTEELFKNMRFEALGLGKDSAKGLTATKNASIGFLRDIKLGAVADFADRGQRQVRDDIKITKGLNEQAESVDALIEKRQKLIAMRATESDKPEGSRASPDSVLRLSKGIAEIDERLVSIGHKRVDLQENLSAGREHDIALAELELETRQKLADVDERVKNIVGIADKDSAKTFAAQKVAIRQEAEQKERLIKLSKVQEQAEAGRLGAIEQTGITFADELHQQDEAIAANDVILDQIKAQGMGETLIAKQVTERGRQLRLAKVELLRGYDIEKAMAENNTRALAAHLAGNQKLADLERNRAQYQIQITEAMRHGKPEIAAQLRIQERLNELEIKARDLLKTPQQRAQERKEQDKFDQAQRTVNAREKDIRARADDLRRSNPRKYAGMSDDEVLGRVDSRDHISKATAKARADFAARQKGVPNKNDPANMALQNITTASIIVTELKSAP